MNLSELSAIGPVDGRYRSKTSELAPYFSEFGLIKYRLLVEVEYFIHLINKGLSNGTGSVSGSQQESLRNIYNSFTEADAQQIKDIEATTNHDVKAVEYFLKSKLKELGMDDLLEYVHFGLTSQDVNNTSIPLSIKDAIEEVYYPLLEKLLSQLSTYVQEWENVSMLARTHGQPASPTRLGKEIKVFVERVQAQLDQIKAIPPSAKFGGATGNFNAHHVAYPNENWVNFGNEFVNNILGLSRSQTTTQIEHYDNLGSLFHGLSRINTILIDFSRDIWTYISMDYFKQKIVKGEVGSSAMPHKVNPIDFENAEGNFGVANAVFGHMAEKLPISRLQRDLTDSTVLRNVGIPFGHTVIGFKSLLKGLGKLVLNQTKLEADLEDNWAVVAEAIQTVLRRENYPNPYEKLKELTRINTKMNAESIGAFIDSLDVNDEIKQELKSITPQNYTGVSL
jgi:adenylosuccinate lyase